jgi:diaminopimelate epimerase
MSALRHLADLVENQVVKAPGSNLCEDPTLTTEEEYPGGENGKALFQDYWKPIKLERCRGNLPSSPKLALPEDCGNQQPMLRFTKMNGAGNDFVLIDNRLGDLRLVAAQIAKICDRHRGIGADGVLLLERAANGADFRMRYYNADGGEAEMCGNGARCFARYASHIAGPMEELSFETPAGMIGATLQGELVRLQMSEPKDLRLGITIPLADQEIAAHFVNSGVPHVVVPVEDLEKVDVRRLGSAVRHHQLFAPKGANVNFLKDRGERQISIRTYERGVENETLACGTGVVASALIFAAIKNVGGPVGVLVRGGNELQVGFEKVGEQFHNVTLTGPADFVFEGTIEV